MIGYTASEQAVIDQLILSFPQLNEYNCKAGDIDSIIDYMFRTPSKYGVLVDFMGGQRRKPENFNAYIWQWNILITFFVRIDLNTIEDDVREILDTLAVFAETNRTLGGKVVKFDLSYIDRPQQGQTGEKPLSWIPITTYVWDK